MSDVVQQGRGAIGNDTPVGPLYEAYHDPSVQPPARDVEAARALLADAGFPDGEGWPGIELVYNTSESHRKIAVEMVRGEA